MAVKYLTIHSMISLLSIVWTGGLLKRFLTAFQYAFSALQMLAVYSWVKSNVMCTCRFFPVGHGLPAGLAEVEMIERARAKRAW